MSTNSQRSGSEPAEQFTWAGMYARSASEPKALGAGKRGRYDFAVAYPDPGSLPLKGLLDGLREAMDEEGGDLSLYANPQGYTPLREFVAAKLQRDRAINVTADDIILADGSSQPIHMVAETLLDPGDVVLTEDFVYAGTLNTLRRFRADLRGVATDEEGMIPAAIEEAITTASAEGKKPKFIYTVPTFQNPQGWTMTLARRKALVALSQQYDVPILEDDCYVDLRYEGNDVTSLHSLDETGRVLYVASFSKIIAPGMRLGYLTGPRQFLEHAIGAKSGGSVNTFASWAVHRFSTTHLYSHIEEINDIQKDRRDAILDALDENFSGSGATWSRPQGGLFIWLQLPEHADLAAVRDDILDEYDVGYLPGPNFAPDGVSGKNCARLCFGYNGPEEIKEGIRRLATALRAKGLIP
ncbi:MAG: PLP-dependent aminotransferase family protein [Caldilineaceae bacterium SB0661_bin_32]|uniref:PLP-dependent aminotransferase family protein n=1 Tax=Caldilineaceae bacterium SB0661_bin_32 TaxID=2605255 RepID=A0A6B1DAY6_9CHLR|nr:PLP-dependent aminotransferase family protein [Caldilineaceae bacterium SB0661_bin_32]